MRRLEFAEGMGDGTVDLRFQNSLETSHEAKVRTGGSAKHIDWVLVHHPKPKLGDAISRCRLIVQTAEVITKRVVSLSGNGRTKRYPSDHYPVAVGLQVGFT